MSSLSSDPRVTILSSFSKLEEVVAKNGGNILWIAVAKPFSLTSDESRAENWQPLRLRVEAVETAFRLFQRHVYYYPAAEFQVFHVVPQVCVPGSSEYLRALCCILLHQLCA